MCLVPTPWATPACWMERGSLSCRGKHWWKKFGASVFTILYCQSAVLLPTQVVLAGCWPDGAGEALRAPPCFHHYVHPSWYGVSSPAFGVGAFGCPADPVALPLVCGLRRSEIVCAERCRQAHTLSLCWTRGGLSWGHALTNYWLLSGCLGSHALWQFWTAPGLRIHPSVTCTLRHSDAASQCLVLRTRPRAGNARRQHKAFGPHTGTLRVKRKDSGQAHGASGRGGDQAHCVSPGESLTRTWRCAHCVFVPWLVVGVEGNSCPGGASRRLALRWQLRRVPLHGAYFCPFFGQM